MDTPPATERTTASALPPLLAAPLLAALVLAAGCGDEPEPSGEVPDPAARVERPAFDAGSAHELLRRQVEFGPRVPGTEGHRAQLEWMVEHLEDRADTVVVDSFRHRAADGRELPLRNVWARFEGAEPGRRVLLLAHWDTRPRSENAPDPDDRDEPVPGANDGASGTAVLLELADVFAARRPPVTVDLLLVDGEDYGPGSDDMYLGARRYAERVHDPEGPYPDGRPTYAVLVDMVADADPRFPVEGYSAERAPQVVQRVWDVAHSLGYGRLFPLRVGQAVTDDHIPLLDAGIPAIDIIDFEYGPGNRFWHTPEDVPENTSPRGLEAVGETLAELIYRGG